MSFLCLEVLNTEHNPYGECSSKWRQFKTYNFLEVVGLLALRRSRHCKTDVFPFQWPTLWAEDNLRNLAENEVAMVIEQAETVVNDVKPRPTELFTVEGVDFDTDAKMCRMRKTDNDGDAQAVCEIVSSDYDREEAILKAQEVFKFLENETTPTSHLPNSSEFLQNEIQALYSDKNRTSGIPVAKPRQKISEAFAEAEILSDGERSVSPDEFLSKIPVSGKGKVKTIKKHSKDPLKEQFVKLTQDVNWDDADDGSAIATNPIVKTTVTRITSEQLPPEEVKTKMTFTEVSPKSKIPVLMTETTRILPLETTYVERTVISPTSSQVIETTLVSPGSETKFSVRSKSSTFDSDSDSDSRRSPPLKGILKKAGLKMVGSSSGSDVALHEGGSELSEDESEDFCQNDQPQYTETTTEEIDPVTGAKITKTTRTISRTTILPGIQNETDVQRSTKEVLDDFMAND